MQGLVGYLQLKAQSKAGLSVGLVFWTLIALLCAVMTLCFIIFAAFIWLAERYGDLNAALALAVCFFLITVIAVISCALSHRRAVRRAKLALASRSNIAWVDPKLLSAGIRMSRAIGWRKLAPLVAVGVLVAGLGIQWFGRTSRISTRPTLAA